VLQDETGVFPHALLREIEPQCGDEQAEPCAVAGIARVLCAL
jgi:hypothetical protein